MNYPLTPGERVGSKMFDISSQGVTNIATMGTVVGFPLLVAFGFHCFVGWYVQNKFLLGVLDVVVAFCMLGLILRATGKI